MTVRCVAVVLGMLSAGWVFGGCGTSHPAIELTSGYATTDTAYGKLLPRYTRESQLYDGFDTVAKGVATWRSPDLLRAAAAASAQRYQLGAAAALELQSAQEQAGRAAREFHLALYTPKKHWNDLESPQTLWRAYLELPGGRRLEPLDVVFLPKSDKSSVEYPYVTPWTREYRVRFPLLEGEETHPHLTLVLAGVLGSLRFAY